MNRIFLLLFVYLFIIFNVNVWACEFCTIAYMGKKEAVSSDQFSLNTQVLYENQDWNEVPAIDAHRLHHQEHHVHNKQDEQIIHTMLTTNINDRLSLEVDIPYVTRHFIEIDSHAHLGENQTSRGLGDLTTTMGYQFIQSEQKGFGMFVGAKLPSGKTNERNSFDELIEPELQPATGSVDYIAGLTAYFHPGNLNLSTSAVYVYKTEGKQDFRFGDVLSVTALIDKQFDINEKFYFKSGILINNQLEKKQNNEDGYIKDSGGYTMLVGPELTLGYDQSSIHISYLSAAVQNLGGVHQELSGIWTGSVDIKF